jgi:voltage-gated potassium channel Kch
MRSRALGYGVVLLLVITSIALQMSLPDSDGSRFVTIVLQAATLVAAVRVSGVRPQGGRIAGLVAVVAVIGSVIVWAARGDFPPAPAAIVNGLLVAFAPLAIARGLLHDLRERNEVTAATLAGVLAIYLLAGMFFSFLYGVIGAVDADALFAQVTQTSRQDELYFSFVTLTTVGYGDLSPAGGVSRAVAVAEMLVGQIYLVTIVSLIVTNLGARRR